MSEDARAAGTREDRKKPVPSRPQWIGLECARMRARKAKGIPDEEHTGSM
jgi:hypothetical protein